MNQASFDFPGLLSTLKHLGSGDQRARIEEEVRRVRELVIRDSSVRFQQQMYLRRLERLLHYFEGHNVTSELTPSEKRAYALLADTPAQTKA